ncbi:phage integrase SAM-like domain-containing protein [Flavobacterium oncorhynchi]|uniref:phage integrase SAM-like domain-containing protein n=1 Tax=Flavobacterium oncorhynchi TaxID=728056 RepID=UPI001FCB1409|nr:phage integrase SAM-like domain-containing protein [Flavobacterium oncorhynchi]
MDKGECSKSTYYKYKIVYNQVVEFIKSRYYRNDMAFRELTCDFIREFDFFLRIDKECKCSSYSFFHSCKRLVK